MSNLIYEKTDIYHFIKPLGGKEKKKKSTEFSFTIRIEWGTPPPITVLLYWIINTVITCEV